MTHKELIEAVAKTIDPEAWGLPSNIEDSTITDRDEARDHARAVRTLIHSLLSEATPEMVEAGWNEAWSWSLSRDNIIAAWRAMFARSPIAPGEPTSVAPGSR